MPDSHKDNFTDVKNIINSVDPVGLVAGGAPEDEYDSQTNKILSFLQGDPDVNSLAEYMYKVFLEGFGNEMVGEKSLYIQMADKIKNSINK